jgi:hypothetical protein
MTEPYDGWLKRKLEQQPVELAQSWTVTKEWRHITGGRIMYADLTLTAEPFEAFAYVEQVNWPIDYPYFKHCVLDGILTGVLIDLGHVPTRVRFTLNAIKWEEQNSVPHAYYQAAREAVKEIFGLNERLRLRIPDEGPN